MNVDGSEGLRPAVTCDVDFPAQQAFEFQHESRLVEETGFLAPCHEQIDVAVNDSQVRHGFVSSLKYTATPGVVRSRARKAVTIGKLQLQRGDQSISRGIAAGAGLPNAWSRAAIRRLIPALIASAWRMGCMRLFCWPSQIFRQCTKSATFEGW